MNRKFKFAVAVLILGMVLLGCATTATPPPTFTADPFNLGRDNNTSVIKLWGQYAGKESNVKIDGEEYFINAAGVNPFFKRNPTFSDEIILPVGKNKYEIMCKVKAGNRGLVGLMKDHVVFGGLELDIFAGKAYALSLEETKGSGIGSMIIGALMPASFVFILYELTPNLENREMIMEFSAKKMKKNDWETFQFAKAKPPESTQQSVQQNKQIVTTLTPDVIFFVNIGGTPTPISISEMKNLAIQGKITRQTLVWKEGMAQWAQAGTVDELSQIWQSVPPPLPPR